MDIIQKILQFIGGGEWGGKSTGGVDGTQEGDFEDILSSILEDILGKGISDTEFKKLLEKFKNVFGNGKLGDDVVQLLLQDILRKMNLSPEGENEFPQQKENSAPKDGTLNGEVDFKLLEVVQKNHDKVNISTAASNSSLFEPENNFTADISIKNKEKSKDLDLQFSVIKRKHGDNILSQISTSEELASKNEDLNNGTNFVRYSGNTKGTVDELLAAQHFNMVKGKALGNGTDLQVSDETHGKDSPELSKVSSDKLPNDKLPDEKEKISDEQNKRDVDVNIPKYKGNYWIGKKGNLKNGVEHVQLVGEKTDKADEFKRIDEIAGDKKQENRDKVEVANKIEKGKDSNTEVRLDSVGDKKVREDKPTSNSSAVHGIGKNISNGKEEGKANLKQRSNKKGTDTLQNTQQDVDGNITDFSTEGATKDELSEKIEREIRLKSSGSLRGRNHSGKSSEDVSLNGGKNSERIVKGSDGFSTEMIKGEQHNKDKVDYMVYGDRTGKELNLGKDASRAVENPTNTLSERIHKMKEVILDSVRISMNSHNKRAVVEANVLGTKVTVDVVVEARNVSVVINTSDSSLRSEISKNFDNFRRFLEENNFQLMRFDVGGGDTTGRGGGYNMEFANEFAGMYGRFRGNHVGSISIEQPEKISDGTIFVNMRGRFNIIA